MNHNFQTYKTCQLHLMFLNYLYAMIPEIHNFGKDDSYPGHYLYQIYPKIIHLKKNKNGTYKIYLLIYLNSKVA